MWKIQKLLFLFVFILFDHSQTQECDQRFLNVDDSVCVCNETYCDKIPELLPSTPNNYQLFISSKSQLGIRRIEGSFTGTLNSTGTLIQVDRQQLYQTIIGFGGAFTDSAGINILSLPEGAQTALLESYFGDSGSGYNLCRVPIGGTDFSIRPYSYDDNPGDITLELWQLQEEDFLYKIPLIMQAKSLRADKEFKLFASAWTAPPWMKTNNGWAGIGFLLEEHYQLWADYYIKFFEAYQANGIEFWGVTTQNEPMDGFLPESLLQINSMGWSPSALNQWIGNNLGPTIRNSAFSHLKIMTFDENRLALPLLPLLLENELTLSYIDGIAVHWYWDLLLPSSLLNFTKTDKKDLFLLSTEACNGYLNLFGVNEAVALGSWQRGELYIKSILEYLENGANGWIDWNMVLDMNGGPLYINNTVDSPIIVNSDQKEFYKQPMYYALAHFSKFAIPDSIRIGTIMNESPGIQTIAFQRPDGLIAVIVYNGNDISQEIILQDSDLVANVEVEAYSINTFIY